ncbi:MAG: transcription factor [Myoviridae sp. ctThM1]|nr:MAG: transcription factor [Myoviridae sp. ctThM1]
MSIKTKLVEGVGINDADYKTSKYEKIDGVKVQVWRCPFYQTWKGMLQRCYNKKFQNRRRSYNGCSVHPEWFLFSNFKAWMETQDWEGKELDKDLLLRGNKLYSPENCVFISKSLNLFIVENKQTRGKLPIGVVWYKKIQKYRATCRCPFTGTKKHLGFYEDAEEAHKAWLRFKSDTAVLLAKEESDPKISKALIDYYRNFNYET